MFMFKKTAGIRRKIQEYLGVVDETIDLFQEGIDYYLERRIDEHFHMLMKKTHAAESRADDLRQEIENEMFSQSLLPESRDDILSIIEKVDCVANKCESILQRIYIQNIVLPQTMNDKFRELAALSTETAHILIKATVNALEDRSKVSDYDRRIDANESLGDALEQDMIYHLFHSDYDPVDRLLYSDVIDRVGDLLDITDAVSSALMIFVIKHQV